MKISFPGNKTTDPELSSLRRVCPQSDSGSFEELVMPLFGRLYNCARWLTQDDHEAEDLVQEACMKALKGFGSFRQGTNFRAWM